MEEIEALYQAVVQGWNEQDSEAMSRPFAEDGTVVGFDGSLSLGKAAIAADMQAVFGDHPTARYVTKVESVRSLGADAALLRALAGMVPPGETRIKPEVNTHHTVVAERRDGRWQLVLYQNTPAQFHGRPQLVEQMTAQLQEVADGAT